MGNLDTLNKRVKWLNWAAGIGLVTLLLLIFFGTPTEVTMGHVYRILYFHVGAAWAAALTFFVALIAGFMYLRTRDEKWDIVSMSSAEIGLVLFTMTIAVGSVWAKPIWGTWWVWSPRLTGVVVTWLVYVAYFMLRSAVPNREQRARFAAVYVIIAFATVILTYASVRFLRDIHPIVVGGAIESVEVAQAAEGESEFQTGGENVRSILTLNYAWIVFTVIYAAWLANRIRLQRLVDAAENLKALTIQKIS